MIIVRDNGSQLYLLRAGMATRDFLQNTPFHRGSMSASNFNYQNFPRLKFLPYLQLPSLAQFLTG